jgi:hypothetical protein
LAFAVLHLPAAVGAESHFACVVYDEENASILDPAQVSDLEDDYHPSFHSVANHLGLNKAPPVARVISDHSMKMKRFNIPCYLSVLNLGPLI